MIPLILFVCLGIVILVIFEVRARRTANSEQSERPITDSEASNSREAASDPDDGCCGEHLVCERETLLQTNAEIIYYDDEELDTLAGIAAEDYTKADERMKSLPTADLKAVSAEVADLDKQIAEIKGDRFKNDN